MNALERAILTLAPRWALLRARARAQAIILARHYEAAAAGRRTQNWHRLGTDANAAAGYGALATLRAQARDLVRNNPWARRGKRRIAGTTVGWGIRPTLGPGADAALSDLWRRWAEKTDCDADGRLTFYGMQRQAMETIVEAGEVLVRRRFRRPSDGLAVPMQLQVLEPDFIDSTKTGFTGQQGGPTILGVEFDAIGRRSAYWLFEQHPGSGQGQSFNPLSRRIPADQLLHVFLQERPGQVRGVSWFAPVDARLHDFDEYEDATLMKQRVAACLTAFVTDGDGVGAPLGQATTGSAGSAQVDTLEPGMILELAAGKQVTVANPPAVNDHQSFSATALRGIAAGLGTTYEDLTGDYSQLTFSGGRMSRLAHMGDVHDWRWNMLVPLFCGPAWDWMVEQAQAAGLVRGNQPVAVGWTPPAAQMIDPDKEGLANQRLVRSGAMTHDEMVREQGNDPETHWKEYAAGLRRLDELGIWLDSDVRRVTASGQAQGAGAKAKGDGGANGKAPPNGSAEPDEPALAEDA